jgi:hypothetical protein
MAKSHSKMSLILEAVKVKSSVDAKDEKSDYDYN